MNMEQSEEYQIIESNIPPIKMDGKFYPLLKERMYAKFKSQPNPEERIKRLEENAKEIFRQIQILDLTEKGDKNLLLVGKVQSGKTSNMQMAVALAFDNGFDSLVLFGGYDNTLVDQAFTRFSNEAFKKPDTMSDLDARQKWVNIFTTREGKGYSIEALDEDNIKTIKKSGGKLIFICRKGPDSIGKINNLLESVNSAGLKALIFDDEGDQASLNNEFRKKGESPTYREIVRLKGLLHNPPYLSVTATPQALVFSPATSHLKPKLLQLIHPGSGYTGLDDFHLGKDRTISVNDEIDSSIERANPVLPKSLWDAVNCYLVSSAILRHRNILNSTQMIVHFDKLTKKHEKVYGLINCYLESFKYAIQNKQDDLLNKKMTDFSQIFCDDDVIAPSVKANLSFEQIKPDLIYILSVVFPALMNSQGKDTMAKLDWKSYQIRVGADLLQRGVSFDTLITTYFTRWPKGQSNMDTQIQRARWLGYRSNFFDYCRVFTTDEIGFSFSKLAEIEDDLWSQMSDVESGSKSLDEIMVEADPKMRPSRRSAADYEIKTFGRKWLNQSIGTADLEITAANNQALKNFISGYEFRPTSKGTTALDPTKITAYHAAISFTDFRKFLDETLGIFENEPFGSKSKLLKIASGKTIDLMIFWDPAKADLAKMDFKEDTRSRRFRDLEGGCRVSALQQGADKVEEELRTYLGDSYVIEDEKAITIQVFPIKPKAVGSPERIVGQTQFMYSVHTPNAVSVYTRGTL